MSPRRDSSAARRLIAAALAVVVSSPLVFSAQSGTPPAGSKTVFVVALDGDNRPVTDLTRDEWRVAEDGVDRPIWDVKTATEPLNLTLVVDTSLSAQSSLSQLRAALISFTHTILSGNQGATMSVMDVAGAAVLVADRKKTVEDLDKVLSRTVADRSLGAVILEGMSEAGRKFGESTARRAIVVVNMDGTPDGSGSKEPQRVIDQVVASGASVWAVSYGNDATRMIGGLQGSGAAAASTGTAAGDIGTSGYSQNRDQLLNLMSAGTGGFRLTIGVPTALEQTLGQVAKALLGQYALTYVRPAGPAPKQLQMGQARAGVKIIYPTTPPR